MSWKHTLVALPVAFMLAAAGCGSSGSQNEVEETSPPEAYTPSPEASSSAGDVAACELVLEDYAAIQDVMPAITGGAARSLHDLAIGLPETFQLAISSAQSTDLSQNLRSASDAATNLAESRYQEAFQFAMEPVVEECSSTHDVVLTDFQASLRDAQEAEAREAELATESWDEYPDEYQNINTLKDAFVSTGQKCNRWQFDTSGGSYTNLSGSCGPTSVLALYSSSEDVEKQLSLARSFSEPDDDTQWLVGKNWTIHADVDLEHVQSLLGGELVSVSGS